MIGLKITKYDRAGLQIGFGLKILKIGLQSAMGLQSVTTLD